MSFSFHRTVCGTPRTNQRVRLQAVAGGTPITTGGIFNLTTRLGDLGRVKVRNDCVMFDYSSFATPPYLYAASVTINVIASDPKFLWTREHNLILQYRGVLKIQETLSYDDGKSWSDPVDAGIGTFPDLSASRLGLIQRSYFDTPNIRLARQYPGQSVPEASFLIADSTLTPLVVEEDSFRIVTDLRNRMWLHVRILGSGATSLWFSEDDGETWAPEPGAVTGIAGGTHPGMAAGHDGTLMAWAYVPPNGYFTQRDAGDTSFSVPGPMKDDAANNLPLADGAFSMAKGWSGTNRWVLAVGLAGESVASDWTSADEGPTWERWSGPPLLISP